MKAKKAERTETMVFLAWPVIATGTFPSNPSTMADAQARANAEALLNQCRAMRPEALLQTLAPSVTIADYERMRNIVDEEWNARMRELRRRSDERVLRLSNQAARWVVAHVAASLIIGMIVRAVMGFPQ